MSDLISRSALIEDLKECLDEENIQHTLEYFGVYDIIRSQPTVEAKPVVHGKWLEIEEKGLFDGEIYNATPRYKCSVCGNDAIKTEKEYRGHGECYVELTWFATDFCPNCGADMRGEKHD